ncbi:MAG: hypothetical protein RL637_1229, partial [Pseudomonadota bacterium]
MFKILSYLFYLIAPLFILFSLISIACILGYIIIEIFGDFWQLHKIISRITQLLLIFSIFPLRKLLQLTWSELGFIPPKLFLSKMVNGFVLGLLTALPVLGILILLDIQILDQSIHWTLYSLFKKISISLILAILIALVEESLFRGVLFSAIQQKCGAIVAIIVSAIYYGSLHFLETNTVVELSQIHLTTSFILFAEAIKHWLDPSITSALMALIIIGIFLASIRYFIPNSLAICIGFHAAWVWQIKGSQILLNFNPNAEYAFLVNPYNGIIGILTSGWLISCLLIYFVVSLNRSR